MWDECCIKYKYIEYLDQYMLLTLQLKLVPDDQQRITLLKTMEQYNAACNYISEVAFESRTFGKVGLQKLVYYDVKDKF